MRCVTINTRGVVVDVDPQPADWSSCALVLQSGAEAGANPFYLSADEGQSVALAIIFVWGVGFGFRAIIQLLKGDSNHVQEDR